MALDSDIDPSKKNKKMQKRVGAQPRSESVGAVTGIVGAAYAGDVKNYSNVPRRTIKPSKSINTGKKSTGTPCKLTDIKFRKRSRQYESMEMIAIFDWIRLNGDLILDCAHVPNEGRRTIFEGMRLKRMGLQEGHSDIIIARPSRGYHGLYIEHKAMKLDGTTGKPTESQREFIARKNKMGYCARVTYGIHDAINLIRWYLEMDSSE